MRETIMGERWTARETLAILMLGVLYAPFFAYDYGRKHMTILAFFGGLVVGGYVGFRVGLWLWGR